MLLGIVNTKKFAVRKSPYKIKTNMNFSGMITNARKKYFNFNSIKRNFMYIFFTLCVLLGLVVGCLWSSTNDHSLQNTLNQLFCTNYTTRLNQEISTTFVSSVTAYFIPILFNVLFGLSFAGVFIVPIVLSIKGLGIGLAVSYLWLTYSLKGCLFALLVVFPGLFLSIVALFLTSKEAMSFSTALLLTQFRSNPVPKAKTFFIKISRVFIILVIASLLDVTLSRCFSRIFIF